MMMMCFLRLRGRAGELAVLRKLAPPAVALGEAPSTAPEPILASAAAGGGSRPADAGADLLPGPIRLSRLLNDPPEGDRPPADVLSAAGDAAARAVLPALPTTAGAGEGLLPGAGSDLLLPVVSLQAVNGHNRQLLLTCGHQDTST